MKRTPSEGYNEYQMRAYAEFGVLISVFVDPENPDDFIAGFVQALTARQAMIAAVSPFGRYDGLIAVRLSDINMVLGEDDYAIRLRMLLLARGAEKPVYEAKADEDLMHAVCRIGMEKGDVVTVWTGEDEICGVVASLDDMRVTIRALDYYGQHPEDTVVVLRDVEMASTGSEDDRMFQLLYEKGTQLLKT